MKDSDIRRTPPDLIRAVDERFGPIAIDLAASSDNAVAHSYICEEIDAEGKSWTYWDVPHVRGVAWLNHPYSESAKWAKRIEDEIAAGYSRTILNLGKCDPSTEYFRRMVALSVQCLFLPRVRFLAADGRDEGPANFPCCLFVVVPGLRVPCSFDFWDYRAEVAA